MPLSSVVGAQSIVKPGVCTSTTRPASPYEGQMIYETDTDILAIYNGSAWRQLAAATATSGSVLQVVQGLQGTGVQNNTNVLADTGLSATITPKSASSKILVTVTQNGVSKESGNAGSSVYLSLRRGASEIHAYNSFLYTGTSSLVVATWSHTQLDSPATTSAITYKTQFCNMVNAAGTYVQRSIGSGWQTSVMVLTEIAG